MTTTAPKSPPRMSVAEFLDWDGGGFVGKLELINGEVRAMSPASGTHALIQANLAYLIGAHLRATKRPCRVGTEAPIVPRFHANDNIRAPDLSVTCQTSPPGKIFPDPVLIIEVLSPSNLRETWESIRACATIPSLAEIMVVDSERVLVEIYRKLPEGGWPTEPDERAQSGAIKLTSIEANLDVAEIYSGTHLV
ncbi:MAG: Uma2 family endonuclease [Hyphomicrobium sp.]